ncbi:hypothetical protein BSFA1_63710 (plasmid) [Burkholderia sp. SFA1]|nr:hypothetical protein BSFA1_63710 [Burkholderia sp. SFA1]
MNNWLSFAVLAAAISTFGALAGVLIKDYFFARSFERWKQQETLEQLYQRFRDPLTLASRELADRIGEIVSDYPTVFLTNNV